MILDEHRHLYPALYNVTTQWASFDVETDGLRPYNGTRMFAYCIGWPVFVGDEMVDVRVDVRRLDGSRRERIRNLRYLKEFFADVSIAKVAHNYKFERSLLTVHNIHVPDETVWHDTMLASQLLRNLAPSHALDYLSWEIFGYTREYDKEVRKMAKAMGGRYDLVDPDLMSVYQYHDGVRPCLLWYLWHYVCQDIHPEGNPRLWEDYLNEIALALTTERMECYGMMIDVEGTEDLLEWLEGQFDDVQRETYEYLREYVNLNSDAKLRSLLFTRMGFPILRYTDKGVASTDKHVMRELKDLFPGERIFDLILRWRSYGNGITMNRKYLELMDAGNVIHPNIKTNHARTGRESSESPNMQNISKEESFDNPFPVPSRKAFRARPRHVMYLVDYAGIEMRLIADRSGEQDMIDAFVTGEDPHHLATEIFGGGADYINKLKASDPTAYKTLRGGVKNMHFALAYGAGVRKLALMLGMQPDEMKPLYDIYEERYPHIAHFSANTSKVILDQGYITTPFGRDLWVPQNKAYSGSNYLIQGTAAGILKRAQVRVDDYLKSEWSDDVRIVLPIHDELVIEMPVCHLQYMDELLYQIGRLMTEMDEIVVALEVECKKTKTTWSQATVYEYRSAA
jgi:DNA polymerase I